MVYYIYCSTNVTYSHIQCCRIQLPLTALPYPCYFRRYFLAARFLKLRFLAGAFASKSLAISSVIVVGSTSLAIRAFFLPSVMYGPYGPFNTLRPPGNSAMFLAASLASF